MIAVDYKFNFTPDAADGITALHERVGERVFNLLTSNGGLYIKFGPLSVLFLLPPFFF